jgi:hypothetical protein
MSDPRYTIIPNFHKEPAQEPNPKRRRRTRETVKPTKQRTVEEEETAMDMFLFKHPPEHKWTQQSDFMPTEAFIEKMSRSTTIVIFDKMVFPEQTPTSNVPRFHCPSQCSISDEEQMEID